MSYVDENAGLAIQRSPVPFDLLRRQSKQLPSFLNPTQPPLPVHPAVCRRTGPCGGGVKRGYFYLFQGVWRVWKMRPNTPSSVIVVGQSGTGPQQTRRGSEFTETPQALAWVRFPKHICYRQSSRMDRMGGSSLPPSPSHLLTYRSCP